jgi:hypothetical protein
MALPYLACMIAAAQLYAIPVRVLPSIQAVEGGFPGAIHPNRDGSDDYGVMQINSRWVQPLAEYVSVKTGVRTDAETVRSRLVADPCYNITAAAVILQAEWRLAGRDWLAAVGNYHSHTPALHRDYLARVTARAAALFGQGG